MKKSKTNLEYLMSLCGIRGVEISKYLHVDQSLIGKWKNGTRTLSPDSGYIKDLTELFIDRGREKIDALFSDVYKDKYNPDYIENFVKAFVCSRDPSIMAKTVLHKDLDADSSAVYYSYNGAAGRKKAMDYLINCAQSAEAAVTIYLYDSTCFDWLVNDEEYFNGWGRQLIDLLANGSDIYLIIDSDTDTNRAASLLYHFYPFSANRRFNVYYVDGVNYPTIYLIGGMAAVTGYNDFLQESFCTQVFTDHLAVRQHELYMRHLLRCRKKDSIKRFTVDECFSNIKNLSVVSSDIYMFSVTPTLYSMPLELMEKVLGYNTALDERVKKRLREFNRLANSEFFPSDRKNCVRCIFPLEELRRAAGQDNVIYSDNLYSDVATLYVHAEDFREHIRFLVRQTQRLENYQIGIVPKIERFGSELSKLGYLACKRQCWAIMSNEHSGTKALFFMNSSLVDLIFCAQDYVWNSISQSYTDKKNVASILEGIVSGNDGAKK